MGSRKNEKRLRAMQAVADALLEKIRQRVEAADPMEMNIQTLKHLSGVLKDLKDIQMLRSEADIAEQEAKIKNLQRQGQEPVEQTLTVVLEGELEAFSE